MPDDPPIVTEVRTHSMRVLFTTLRNAAAAPREYRHAANRAMT